MWQEVCPLLLAADGRRVSRGRFLPKFLITELLETSTITVHRPRESRSIRSRVEEFVRSPGAFADALTVLDIPGELPGLVRVDASTRDQRRVYTTGAETFASREGARQLLFLTEGEAGYVQFSATAAACVVQRSSGGRGPLHRLMVWDRDWRVVFSEPWSDASFGSLALLATGVVLYQRAQQVPAKVESGFDTILVDPASGETRVVESPGGQFVASSQGRLVLGRSARAIRLLQLGDDLELAEKWSFETPAFIAAACVSPNEEYVAIREEGDGSPRLTVLDSQGTVLARGPSAVPSGEGLAFADDSTLVEGAFLDVNEARGAMLDSRVVALYRWGP